MFVESLYLYQIITITLRRCTYRNSEYKMIITYRFLKNKVTKLEKYFFLLTDKIDMHMVPPVNDICLIPNMTQFYLI